MKAVGFYHSLPIDEAESLIEVTLQQPAPGPNDLLVSIEAVSVNPADAKRRIRTAVDTPHASPLVLGYDAVGIVSGMGEDVVGFELGQRVWYAGDAGRPGSNAEQQLVDHRIASRAPKNTSPAEAASLPLVSLTAWEMLFDRLQVPRDTTEKSLLVIGGAGGVGSATIQLARQLTGLEIYATASRDESADWCRKMGAHHIVDHRDLVASFRSHDCEFADYIVQYADMAMHWDAMCELIAPQGRIGSIVESSQPIDVTKLQGKSAALMWELMFTRSMFQTSDMARQGAILSRVAEMVDDGRISTTATQHLRGLSAATLKEAHSIVETGAMIGKLVVDYQQT